MNKEVPIAMDNIIDDEMGSWFLDYKTCVLYIIDSDDFHVVPIACLKPNSIYKDYPKIYGQIIMAGGKIFAVPEAPVPIAVYDIYESSVTFLEYDIDDNLFLGKVFSGAYLYNNIVYFIPCCYDYIIGLNHSDYSKEYYRIKSTTHSDEKSYYLWDGFYSFGDKLVFSEFVGNSILLFDMSCKTVKSIIDIEGIDGFAGVVGDGDVLWAIPLNTNSIYKISLTDKRVIDIVKDFPDGYTSGEWSFSRVVDLGKTTFLLPRDANMCVCFDKETGLLSCVSLVSPNRRTGNYYSKYMFYCSVLKKDNRLYLLESESGIINCLDNNMELIDRYSWQLDDEMKIRIINSPYTLLVEDA